MSIPAAISETHAATGWEFDHWNGMVDLPESSNREHHAQVRDGGDCCTPGSCLLHWRLVLPRRALLLG